MLFILFAENSQILLKVSVIPIILTSMYLVALNLLVSKQPTQLIVELNSSLRQMIDSMDLSHIFFGPIVNFVFFMTIVTKVLTRYVCISSSKLIMFALYRGQ